MKLIGMVIFMKLLVITVLLVSFFISCNKEVDISNLTVVKNELVYEKGKSTPFSGTAILKKDDKTMTVWNYKNGKADGICKNYYENGNLKFWGEFKNGFPNGVVKEYNRDGTLILQESYIKGTLNGEKKEFYENGALKNLETYQNDFLNGPRIVYDQSGNIKIREIYNNDEIVTSEIWPEKK